MTVKHITALLGLLAAFISHGFAQVAATDAELIEIAKGNYAAHAQKPRDQILFSAMKVVRSSDSAVICGAGNGVRFISFAKADTKPWNVDDKPDHRSTFAWSWDIKCEGYSADEAAQRLTANLRENICMIDTWDWGMPTSTSMRIMGTASCSAGILRITAFDNGKEIGVSQAKIVDRKFTANFSAAPPSGAGASIKIKYLSAAPKD